MTTYSEEDLARRRVNKPEMELRRFCLEQAVSSTHGRGMSPENIIGIAEKFERYVRAGVEPPKPTIQDHINTAAGAAIASVGRNV